MGSLCRRSAGSFIQDKKTPPGAHWRSMQADWTRQSDVGHQQLKRFVFQEFGENWVCLFVCLFFSSSFYWFCEHFDFCTLMKRSLSAQRRYRGSFRPPGTKNTLEQYCRHFSPIHSTSVSKKKKLLEVPELIQSAFSALSGPEFQQSLSPSRLLATIMVVFERAPHAFPTLAQLGFPPQADWIP